MEKIHTGVKRQQDNPMPATDEGWWESLLAEDVQRNFSATRKKGSNPGQPPGNTGRPETNNHPAHLDVNWERVTGWYRADRIIEVNAIGHNRGGILVDGEGIPGFIPFSHLIEFSGKGSDSDREHCFEKYKGKTLDVKVIECSPEEGRLVFSERAALSQSGRRVEVFNHLRVGDSTQGTVTNITDFGVFVDLGGVEGLIHISELSWGRVSHPDQIVRLGEEVKVRVLDTSAERNRVALSLKRMTPNPWEYAGKEFIEGQTLIAEITEVISYGAFARIHYGVEGLIHVSEMNLPANQTTRDFLQIGQKVEVRIIYLDPAHQKMGLSLNI